jgi:hypothetical protein
MSGRSAAGPWYGFLYRLLGAHGTFWLWVLSVVAMWWTWQGALLSILDREPERRTVAEIALASDVHRWVSLSGVEVLVDSALLGRDPSSAEPVPTPILIDAGDPAARFWLLVKVCARLEPALRGRSVDGAAAALGDASALAPRAMRIDVEGKLDDSYVALRKNVKSCLPGPNGAVLLLRGAVPASGELPGAAIGSGSVVGPPGTPSPNARPAARPGELDEIDPYARSVTEWGERVRERVHLRFPTGLLDSAPRSLLERLEKDPGLVLAPSALSVDRRPRDAELYVFCGASLFMVFLAAGFSRSETRRAEGEPR